MLKPGGLLILNTSDFIRRGGVVTDRHIETLERHGFTVTAKEKVTTQRMRRGENHQARVEGEDLVTLTRLGEASNEGTTT